MLPILVISHFNANGAALLGQPLLLFMQRNLRLGVHARFGSVVKLLPQKELVGEGRAPYHTGRTSP